MIYTLVNYDRDGGREMRIGSVDSDSMGATLVMRGFTERYETVAAALQAVQVAYGYPEAYLIEEKA